MSKSVKRGCRFVCSAWGFGFVAFSLDHPLAVLAAVGIIGNS